MSINQYSTDIHHSLWWQQQQHSTETPPTGNINPWARFQSDAVGQQLHRTDREELFEKPLTPSDVGKLNRLVIPKQHAEKYFPLSGGVEPTAVATGEKGVLLCFEDEEGKPWRFRYSYWNSSQSYVLTKGWSRYVKEKQLDAGDVVFFHRHRTDAGRLFIGWRRRGSAGSSGGGGGLPVGHHFQGVNGSIRDNNYSMQFNQSGYHIAGQMVENKARITGNSRTLRLFGVNLECQPDEDGSEPSTPDGSSYLSGHSSTTQYYYF